MDKFFTNSNNGVVAVVTAEIYCKLQERELLMMDCEKEKLPRPQLPPIKPIFTFSNTSHRSFRFMTGSTELLHKLLEGRNVSHGNIWVPFSNGIELGLDASARWEQQFRTSLDDAFEAFGVQIPYKATKQRADLPLSIRLAIRFLEGDLEYAENGIFDGEIVRENLSNVLNIGVPQDIKDNAREGLRLIGPHGIVLEENLPQLKSKILEVINELLALTLSK